MAWNSDQKGVAWGMAAGLATSLGAWVLPPLFSLSQTTGGNLADRVMHWLPWELPAIGSFAAGIAWIARHRFLHADVIDGQNPADDHRFQTARAYLQNTHEQLTLALAIKAILVVLLPIAWLSALPATGILFAVGRLFFAVGYSRGAASRAFGFAITFYPSVIGLLVALALAVARALAV